MNTLLYLGRFLLFGFSANAIAKPMVASDSLPDALPQKVDLKPFCPEVGNERNLPSCVGWAAGYGALTIERAIQQGCTDPKIITHSKDNIRVNIYQGCHSIYYYCQQCSGCSYIFMFSFVNKCAYWVSQASWTPSYRMKTVLYYNSNTSYSLSAW